MTSGSRVHSHVALLRAPGPAPLHLSPLGAGAFDGELRILRPR